MNILHGTDSTSHSHHMHRDTFSPLTCTIPFSVLFLQTRSIEKNCLFGKQNWLLKKKQPKLNTNKYLCFCCPLLAQWLLHNTVQATMKDDEAGLVRDCAITTSLDASYFGESLFKKVKIKIKKVLRAK